MRHRRTGRSLNRSSPHKHSMLRNMACSLILSEQETDELTENAPKVKGRIVTTLAKAKELRPFLEKCITAALKAQPHRKSAAELETSSERNSSEWKAWRKSARYMEWNKAISPVVATRRRLLQLLGNKNAVRFLVDELAERFDGRKGGYLRIVKLAKPRLGDAGPRALIEFTGVRDRVAQKSAKPALAE